MARRGCSVIRRMNLQNGSIPVKTAAYAKSDPRRSGVAVKSCGDKRKDSLTKPVNEPCKWARQNSNLGPPPYQGESSESQGIGNVEVTTTVFSVCTSVCASDTENANAGGESANDGLTDEATGTDSTLGRNQHDDRPSDALAALAAAIASLASADRAGLMAMIGSTTSRQ